MELVKRLANLASSLDAANLAHMADDVDTINNNLVKVSQYLGFQGHWVRNERCWSNCYRQKRQASPKKPAQTIWFDCQKEYEESITKQDSDWDKYAGDDGVVKSANTQELDQAFLRNVSARVEFGEDLAEVVYSVLGNELNTPSEVVLASSEKLVNIALRLEVIDDTLAKEAGELSVNIIKLAQYSGDPVSWLHDLPKQSVDTIELLLNATSASMAKFVSMVKVAAAPGREQGRQFNPISNSTNKSLDYVQPQQQTTGSNFGTKHREQLGGQLLRSLTMLVNTLRTLDPIAKEKGRLHKFVAQEFTNFQRGLELAKKNYPTDPLTQSAEKAFTELKQDIDISKVEPAKAATAIQKMIQSLQQAGFQTAAKPLPRYSNPAAANPAAANPAAANPAAANPAAANPAAAKRPMPSTSNMGNSYTPTGDKVMDTLQNGWNRFWGKGKNTASTKSTEGVRTAGVENKQSGKLTLFKLSSKETFFRL